MTLHAHRSRHRGPLTAVIFTIVMVALLVFATHPIAQELSFLMVAMTLLAVLTCTVLLPGSLFFSLALANLIAVYSCLFAIILDSHFRVISTTWKWVGFAMPLVSFFAGSLLRRRTIRAIVRSHINPDPAEYAHALLIMLPLMGIATAAMIYTSKHHEPDVLRNIFAASMILTSIIVFFASRILAIFLLVTGLLFESFFWRMGRLVAPAFAFFTFYSFTVLVFASLYAGIDGFTDYEHFRIMGRIQEIDFPEALYYSLVTLATVGYGDIVPASNVMRLLSGLEVICGVMLLLFGFNEILEHARENRHRDKDEK